MATTIVQIGNSDDKLTQSTWAEFVRVTDTTIGGFESARHFSGGSVNYAPWQNYAWISEIPEDRLTSLKHLLREVAKQYQQDSIALTIGNTEFISA